LVDRRRAVKLRIRGLLRENRLRGPQGASAWTKAWLLWLETQAPLAETDRFLAADHLAEIASLTARIAAIEKRIVEATAADAVVAKLMSLAGVGLVTAVTLRAEVGRFERFDTGKQLARFCGVTPRNASSGQRQADAGLIQPRRSPTARRADRIGPSADQHADWPLGEARRRHAPAGQAQERGRGRSRQSLGPLAAP
jgi:transposase